MKNLCRPSPLLYLILALLTLSGCGGGNPSEKKTDEQALDTLSIAIDDGQERTYHDAANETVPEPAPAPPPIGSESPPPVLHLGGSVPRQPVNGEYTARVDFELASTENSAPNDIVISIRQFGIGHFATQDVEAFYGENYAYFMAGEVWPDAPISIDITDFNAETGRTLGSFDITLCYVDAIDANTCDLDDNRLTMRGHFDVTLAVVDESVDSFAAEGSLAAPLVLGRVPVSVDDSYAFRIVDGTASYYKIDVDAGKDYSVQIQPGSTNPGLDLYVYGDAGFTNELCHVSAVHAFGDSCRATSTGDALYVKVVYTGDLSTENPGAFYTMAFDDVTQYPSEGVDAPLDLGDQLPLTHPGSVKWESQYRLTVTPGTNYTVSLTESTTWYLSLEVRSSQSDVMPDCHSLLGQLSCSVTASTNELFVTVVSIGLSGGAYSLRVEQGGDGRANEGSADNPMDLGSEYPISHQGQVDAGVSNYLVSTVPDQTYTLRLEDSTSDDLSVDVYDSSSPNVPVQHCSIKLTKDCPFVARGDTSGILIDGSETTSGASYRLIVTQGGTTFAAEGSAYTPLPIAATVPFTYDGSVSGVSSYYTIAVDPDKTYTVNIGADADHTRFFVFEDKSQPSGGIGNGTAIGDVMLCNSGFVTRQQQRCVIRPTRDAITVVVTRDQIPGRSVGGTEFTLSVEEGGTPYFHDGEWGAPMDLSGTLPVTYAGSLDYQASIYTFTADPNTQYSINATNLSGAIFLSVQQGSNSCSDSRLGIDDRHCVITTDDSGAPISINIFAMRGISGATYTLNITSP